MTKINELDLKVNGGHHQLTIGVMKNAGWPFYWYLRNYPNACFNFPTYCSVKNPSIIIGAQDDSFLSSYMNQYLTRQYKLRSWWDEGYKPAPCVPSKTVTCDSSQTWGGVGPGLWLSYGDNPPPGAGFNLGLAVKNIWNWWWYRKPIGSTDGAYYITVFVQKGLGVEP
ncbi:MAG: hypothetical protein JO031_06135 [Ktedonobacteraceae bacterium]|nr:hypothetical protein [Ktedonobacteraceae bacterium]